MTFFFFPSSRAWSDMCVDGVCLSVFIPVTVRPVSSKATLLPDALTLVPHTAPARPSERLYVVRPRDVVDLCEGRAL